jgi:predicted protein tyrosine phosphatase
MKKFLFICSQNKLRSPTAENIFSNNPSCDVRSAGVSSNAQHIVTSDDLEWADYIFAMEEIHKTKLVKNYKKFLKGKKIIVLNIPDKYGYMDQTLIKLLQNKMKKWIEP